MRCIRLQLSLANQRCLALHPWVWPSWSSSLAWILVHRSSPYGFRSFHSSLPFRLPLHRHHAVILSLLCEHVANPVPSSSLHFINDLLKLPNKQRQRTMAVLQLNSNVVFQFWRSLSPLTYSVWDISDSDHLIDKLNKSKFLRESSVEYEVVFYRLCPWRYNNNASFTLNT